MATPTFELYLKEAWLEFDIAWLIFNEFTEAAPQSELHLRRSWELLELAASDQSALPALKSTIADAQQSERGGRNGTAADSSATLKHQFQILHHVLHLASRSQGGSGWWTRFLFRGMGLAVGVLLLSAAVFFVGQKMYALLYPPAPITVGELTVIEWSQSWGVLRTNSSVEGNELRIAGESYNTGFGTHAQSQVRLQFARAAKRLVGRCGVDDESSLAGTVVCSVRFGNEVVASSPVLHRGDTPWSFDVPVQGKSEVVLVISDGGDGIASDHADWVDLQLE